MWSEFEENNREPRVNIQKRKKGVLFNQTKYQFHLKTMIVIHLLTEFEAVVILEIN